MPAQAATQLSREVALAGGAEAMMTMIMRYAALGALSGAVTAGIVLAAPDDSRLALYCAPGLVFGVIIGGALMQSGLLRGAALGLYPAAAVLSNAAAVFLAIEVFDAASHLFGSEILTLAVIGLPAGALGATLLTLATKALLPLAEIRWPIAAGTLCGALLPAMVDGEIVGAFVFYVIWQAAYAAALALGLPPKR